MHLSIVCFLLQAATGIVASAINNMNDGSYEERVRHALSMFHINLSEGKYSANGPMVSFDMEWNRNGGLQLSRKNFVTTLTTFNDSFHGLQVPDRYHIVDGNVGAVLYHLQGPQTGEFEGIPNTGKLLDIMGAELMEFDSDAKLDYLITIEEFGIAIDELSGKQPISSPTPVSLFKNPQTSQEFRQKLREQMASLHRGFNLGQHSAIADLATQDVIVNADGTRDKGQNAFVALTTSDLDAFPDKIFHDDFILADGHLGAIESVWEGTQTGVYTGPDGNVIQPTGQSVRVRSLLFLEFNDQALISSATVVHDEAVVARQLLENQSDVAYPLYP